ncbi:MAG: hypothetical protein OEX19_13790, partial [Gammaproteobacteria bacterium]|nr:hypothetical protein [Gammaproteobacteria bacterium]
QVENEVLSSELETDSAQAIPELDLETIATEKPSETNLETSAEADTKETPQKTKTIETISALNATPVQAREMVVDKPTTAIIANLLSDELENTETASINPESSTTEMPSSAKLDPTRAFASENQ